MSYLEKAKKEVKTILNEFNYPMIEAERACARRRFSRAVEAVEALTQK